MGFDWNEDGTCCVCGKLCDFYCDSCRDFICIDHQKKIKVKNGIKGYIQCPACYKKRRRIRTPIKGYMLKDGPLH